MFYRYTDNEFININNIVKIKRYDNCNGFWKIYTIDGEEFIVYKEAVDYILKNNVINPKPNGVEK